MRRPGLDAGFVAFGAVVPHVEETCTAGFGFALDQSAHSAEQILVVEPDSHLHSLTQRQRVIKGQQVVDGLHGAAGVVEESLTRVQLAELDTPNLGWRSRSGSCGG